MMLCIKFASAGASAVIPGACTPTGATERNAAYGGVGGATKGWIGSEDCDAPGIEDQADERDSDGDGDVDAYDRYPNDRYRW